MKQIYSLLFLSILFLSSCKLINPDEDIPAHITISKVSFKAKAMQGSDSVQIKDIWIYMDNDLVGSYQLPLKAPILKSGKHSMTLRPGVILNGISATRSVNPFYTSVTSDVDLVAGQSITTEPHFTYADGVKFPWNSRGEEDFEEAGITIDSVSSSSCIIRKTNKEVYEGRYSGIIHLDQGHKNYIGQSSRSFVLPKNKAAVVMEIHVKNTKIPLYIGMYVNLPGGTVMDISHLGVKPSAQWKMLYVNFTELVSYYPKAESYKVTFKADLGNNDSANVYLDDIKIMHF